MLFYHLFERQAVTPGDVSTFNPNMGSQQVSVPKYTNPEEEAALQNAPNRVLNFPVMYVYNEPMADNIDRQDALKMRTQDRFKTPEHEGSIGELVNRSVQTAMGYDSRYSAGRRISPHTGQTEMAARYLQNKKAVVVPLPSSSKLSSMIANSISQAGGQPIVNAFSKQRPNWSAKGAEKAGLGTEDPRGNLEQMNAQLDQMMDQYANLDPANAQQSKQAKHLEDSINKLEQKIKNFDKGHSQKSQYSNIQSNRGRLYYGHFAPTEEAKKLNGKDIVIVDDNIHSGQTYAEAVKALLAAGIVPNSVVGFAMHQFE